ncbi:CsbD family protein [Arenimonas sp.]|uniref:CsbD family protein n=1 Tax=Arenimonas sp. TaxID=1872635 RepID=UPI0039E251D1
MNNDIIKGKWRQLAGRMKRQWGRLTDDDLAVLEGTRDYLSGRIQERYGLAREAAERQVREFERQL